MTSQVLGAMGRRRTLAEAERAVVGSGQVISIRNKHSIKVKHEIHNTTLEERSRNLLQFSQALADRSTELASILCDDVEITPVSAESRDIGVARSLLETLNHEDLSAFAPDFELKDQSPTGTVAAILPYNSIFMSLSMVVATAYLAGNEVIVRFPSKLGRLSKAVIPLLEEALPGVRWSGDVPGPAFLNWAIESPEVACISCFGDDKWVDSYALKVRRNRKKFIFEGPGKDAFVVFPDADLDDAADAAVRTGTANAGQSCSSPERFYVHEEVHDEFVRRVVERVLQLRIGHVRDPLTDVGPTGSPRVISNVLEQLADAKAKGARVLCGGEMTQVDGNLNPTCQPTVLTNGTHEMKIFRDETFAPVLPIASFGTEAEALQLATDSPYGLTATVYGGTQTFVDSLRQEFGNVFFNACIGDEQHSKCRLRWGGFKNSGWIWEWRGGNFVRREGPRLFVEEFCSNDTGEQSSATASYRARGGSDQTTPVFR